jgi:hypothetical protein
VARPSDYPGYKFLFQQKIGVSSKVVNGESDGYDKHEESTAKYLSRFSTVKLSSVHDFFVFSSTVVEVRPQANLARSSSSKALKDVIIRYYTK